MEAAIAEEKAKADAKSPQPPDPSEHYRTMPKNAAEPSRERNGGSETDSERTREMERENLDLKIANRGKDFLIEQMQKERTGFFDQLLSANRKVGELEVRLLQVRGPRSSEEPPASV